MAELKVVEGHLLREAEEVEQLAPVLLLEGLSCAELDKGPGLLELLDLLLEEACHHRLVLRALDPVRPCQEEVLERVILFLSVREPLLFAHLVELALELLEKGPGLTLHLELVPHAVEEGEGGLCLAEVLAVSASLRYSH